MESMNAAEAKPLQKERGGKAPDRVTLSKLEGEKVERWLSQITNASKGFLTLTKSDVINFLVRCHGGDLLPKEISQIRSDHYDPVRHITWITPQIKAALAAGDTARVVDLQVELRGVELAASKPRTEQAQEGRRPRQLRGKKLATPQPISVPIKAEN